MKSIKVKTQKTLSALLGVALAAVILLQTGNVQSKESNAPAISAQELEILADIEQMFLDDEEITFEDEIVLEEFESFEVKVFDNDNNLIAEGSPEGDEELRKLVNQADLLSEIGGKKYFRVSDSL